MNSSFTKLIASGIGLGYAPLMPGTFGSLWGCVLFYWMRDLSYWYFLLIAIVFTAISVLVSHEAEHVYQQKDCQKIVIDEVAGQLITYLFVSFSFSNLVYGFVLFRFFDITKIYPARWAQNNLPGGFGITMDDVIAGVQAGIVLYFMPNIIAVVERFI